MNRAPTFKRIRIPRAPSALEENLMLQIRVFGLPEPVREFRFSADQRKWRFDFAWPRDILPGRSGFRLACECEGGLFKQGRHNRPLAYAADCEKYNAAACQNWIVLRFTDSQIRSLYAVKMLKEILIDGVRF